MQDIENLNSDTNNEEATKLYVHGSLNPGDWAAYKADFLVGTVLVCPKKFVK